MTERQNVTLIRKAFGRGDIQTILDHCTSNCEFYLRTACSMGRDKFLRSNSGTGESRGTPHRRGH
jgi:hypothetical protein